MTDGRVAVELEARNGAFEANVRRSETTFAGAMSTIERSASRAEVAVRSSSNAIAVSTEQAAQRSRLLGFQIQDIGVQLAGGQSPFLILAQQGGQVASALDGANGAVGRVAAALSGPFGSAALIAVSVLGQIAVNALSASDAKEKQKSATDALKESVDRLNNASATLNQTTRQGIADSINDANAKRAQEIQTRGLIKARLELAAANVREAGSRAFDPTQVGEGGFNPGAVAQSSAARYAAQLTAEVKVQDAKIAEATRAVASGRAQLVLRDVAAATDKAAAATQRYEDRIDALQRKFERGGFGDPNSAGAQGEFQRLATAATQARDAALEVAQASDKADTSTKKHGASTRAQTTAVREAAKALRELEGILEDVQRRLDPDGTARAAYRQTGADIDRLLAAGKISDGEAFDLKRRADQQEIQRQTDLFNRMARETLGITGNPLADVLGAGRDEQREERQARDETERRIQAVRENNIRDLAYLYEDMFLNGTGNIFDNFRRLGIRAISEVLARMTFGGGPAAGGGGLLNSALGALGIPGFATGGAMVLGGRGGVDQNVLSLNGSPIARVSRGEGMTISPNASAARPSQSPVIVQVQVEEGQLFRPVVRQISAATAVPIARQVAVSAAAQVGQAVMKGVPQRMSQYQIDGT